MVKKDKKQPKIDPALNKTANEKKPKIIEDLESKKSIVFRFNKFDSIGPDIKRNSADVIDILKAFTGLRHIENTEWKKLIQDEHNHAWDVNDLHEKVRKRFKELKLEENIDNLYQLHPNWGQKPRLFGLKIEDVFYVLWIDHDHVFYRTK